MLNFAYCSDKYQYTMGKSFYDSGMKDQHAVFNMFYRKAPENNNWAVVSGVDEVIEMIENLGNMDPVFFEKFLPGEEYADFRGYLSAMKFTGTVYAMREGEIVFPNQPIIIVEGPLIEAQVLETPMLCIMNHQMASHLHLHHPNNHCDDIHLPKSYPVQRAQLAPLHDLYCHNQE